MDDIWNRFQASWAGTPCASVPTTVADQLGFDATSKAFSEFAERRARELVSARLMIHTAPETHDAVRLESEEAAPTWVLCDVLEMANKAMNDELERQVALGTLSHNDALSFVQGESRTCLNHLLPSHLRF